MNPKLWKVVPLKSGRKYEYQELIIKAPGWDVSQAWNFGPIAYLKDDGTIRIILQKPLEAPLKGK